VGESSPPRLPITPSYPTERHGVASFPHKESIGQMSLRIQNNIEAFNTHRQLQISSDAASSSMEKLSSGYRINRAADDAAGLAISEQMRGQIGGLDQAQRNAQDGVSLVQTAEGSLNEVHSMLQRLRDLKVQFNNGTLDSDDQDAIAAEVAQIGQELGDIAKNTSFNGNKLLQGSTFTFQVGANDNETITTQAVTMSGAIASGGLSEITGLSSTAAAKTALSSGSLSTIDLIDDAIKNVSTARANYGAVQNRLEHRMNNLATYQENLTASESRIRDVDMAAEMTSYTKENILQQAGTSMLAQANQMPQNILQLLKG
jgi:flagellin